MSDRAKLSVHRKPTSGKGHWKNTKSTSNASHKYQGSGKPGKGQQQNVGGPKSTTFKKDTWCVRRTAPRKLTIGCSRSS